MHIHYEIQKTVGMHISMHVLIIMAVLHAKLHDDDREHDEI